MFFMVPKFCLKVKIASKTESLKPINLHSLRTYIWPYAWYNFFFLLFLRYSWITVAGRRYHIVFRLPSWISTSLRAYARGIVIKRFFADLFFSYFPSISCLFSSFHVSRLKWYGRKLTVCWQKIKKAIFHSDNFNIFMIERDHLSLKYTVKWCLL